VLHRCFIQPWIAQRSIASCQCLEPYYPFGPQRLADALTDSACLNPSRVENWEKISAARRSRLHDLRHIDGRLNLPRGGSCQDCRPTFRIEDRGTCLSTPDRGPKDTSVGNLYTRSSKSSFTGPHPVGNLSTLRFETPVPINKGLIRFIQSKWHVFCYSIDGIIPVSNPRTTLSTADWPHGRVECWSARKLLAH
jgi:hypothetical protein